jgi:hypothetical protein
MQYLSQLKIFFENRIPELSLFNDEKWTSKTRAQARRKIIERCFANELPIINRAKPLKEDDLRRICFMLFKIRERSLKCFEDRALFAFQWQICGRAMESAYLTFQNLKFNSTLRCIEVGLMRRKTGDPAQISFFIHKEDWKSCIYHSLACFIILVEPLNPRIFSGISNESNGDGSKYAAYINRVFDFLEEMSLHHTHIDMGQRLKLVIILKLKFIGCFQEVAGKLETLSYKVSLIEMALLDIKNSKRKSIEADIHNEQTNEQAHEQAIDSIDD